ncbi:MAG: hypothetical protein ACJ78Q_03570 [Chloroflexia bacterium]
MILARDIFQAQFGRGGELARAIKEGAPQIAQLFGGKVRVLTDLSGQFDTVVVEMEVDSLAKWEQARREMFTRPDFRQAFEHTGSLIAGGRSEFFNIE